VSLAVRALDRVLAQLLERLASVDDTTAACSTVLDAVLAETGFTRAVLAIRTDTDLIAVCWGIPPQQITDIRRSLTADSDFMDRLVGESSPVLLSSRQVPQFGDSAVAMVPFHGRNGAFGFLLTAAEALDAQTELAHHLLRRAGPTLLRCYELELLAARASRLDRQRDLLTSIINALVDPVVLTNEQNDILLTNQRAERLFSQDDQDSSGRRRAVQINNLLFSSFLTQSVMGGPVSGRELNLVDPSEGSDLMFEVFSVPVLGAGGQNTVISILRDITDLKRAVSQLETEYRRSRSAEYRAREERDRMNVILENVSDPILLTDDNSNIILMNPEADRLFVVPPDADQQSIWSRQVRSNDTRFTTLISDFMLRSERRLVERVDLTDPDTGRTFPAEVFSTKIMNARGEPVAIVSVLHDLTQVAENQRLARELQLLNEQLEERIHRATVELEERNRQLEWQSAELEKASRLKSEFLAAMSHELRTPLNVIIGYSSLMRERIYGELTTAQEDTLQRVHATSQHLLQLINNILDLSKIEAGKMPLYIEPISLSTIISELSETVMPMVRRKELAFTSRVHPDLPIIETDSTKLKQVLLNLLSNAIKFTREGSVEITAEPLGRDRIRVTVCDTGIGIRKEHLNVIFEYFRQLDQSHTREYGGTGLGLTITQNLLSLLGGNIEVSSTFGQGSCFIVDLPVRFSDPVPQPG